MPDIINVVFLDLDPEFDIIVLAGDVQQVTMEGVPGSRGAQGAQGPVANVFDGGVDF